MNQKMFHDASPIIKTYPLCIFPKRAENNSKKSSSNAHPKKLIFCKVTLHNS